MIGSDTMAARAAPSSFAVAVVVVASSVPESSGEAQSPSGTNVPPTNVSHAISLPSQSDEGDIVMMVETILTSSTSTTHHPASPSGGHPPEPEAAMERTPPSPSHPVRMSSSVHADPWYCAHASPPEKTLA